MIQIIHDDHPDDRLLKHFLYLAIFVPEGTTPPSTDILSMPELRVYLDDFGTDSADTAVLAVEGKHAVGLVFARIMDDYGHIAENVPSIAISVEKADRGKGIGEALLKNLMKILRTKGFEAVSLSVQKKNPAVHLYRRLGFVEVSETEDEWLMIRELKAEHSTSAGS